jgi:murein DD-endopeptidase MepM/ murein hydrolase activator NlpD
MWSGLGLAAMGASAAAEPRAAAAQKLLETACVRSESVSLSYRARALAPGEVVLVSARVNGSHKTLRLDAFGQSVTMASAPGAPAVWQGLAGLDLDIQPGAHRIAITSGTSEELFAAVDGVPVLAKTFPTRSIRVAPRYATPPPEMLVRIEREAETMRTLLAAASPERLWSGAFRLPVAGPVISGFGKRSIVNGVPRSPHAGIDLRARTGTPLRAPNRGRVTLVDDLYFTGTTIVIDHGLGVHSVLCHLSSVRVRPGDSVARGQLIGATGASGRATGPHLHWSIRVNGARVDPLAVIAVTSAKAATVALPPCGPEGVDVSDPTGGSR